MRIISLNADVTRWELSGVIKLGGSVSISPEVSIILTPEHPADKAFFIVTFKDEIIGKDGFELFVEGRAKINFENDNQAPQHDLLIKWLDSAFDAMNASIKQHVQNLGAGGGISFEHLDRVEAQAMISRAITTAYPLN